MPAATQTYLRCTHCRGFYEADRAACKWCHYDAPLLDAAGQPRAFPDRDACRAIQLAEYQQLPPEAHADTMGPPTHEPALLCNCLHCGPSGHTFEAIEMRWLANEQMWACPCTTCGGRGFQFDIHSAEDKWQCADCGHFYLPEDGDYHHGNAKCPKCGSTRADGWFEDDYDEDDDLDLPPRPGDADAPAGADDSLPWDDDEDDDDPRGPGHLPDGAEYDLGISWRERGDAGGPFDDDDDAAAPEDPFATEERMPDDIDFPRDFKRDDRGDNTPLSDDDIPF